MVDMRRILNIDIIYVNFPLAVYLKYFSLKIVRLRFIEVGISSISRDFWFCRGIIFIAFFLFFFIEFLKTNQLFCAIDRFNKRYYFGLFMNFIDFIINFTRRFHDISLQMFENGKSFYSKKLIASCTYVEVIFKPLRCKSLL